MMAMVDNVTGMVYWVPIEYQPPIQPPFAPVVMPYRLLRPGAPTVMASATAGQGVTNTTVFVRGVPREATTQSVEAHFRAHGEIASCHVIRHKDASTNKGIAFVKFHDHQSAQRAIACTSPGVMDGREIFAEWAHPKPATSGPRPLLDHPVAVPEYIPVPRPNLFLAPPATHLINPSPSFLPAAAGAPAMQAFTFSNAHLPWMVPSSSTAMAPFGSYGSHVLGFPHPAHYSGAAAYGQEISLAPPVPTYFPAVNYTYDPGSGSAAAVSSALDAEHSDDSQSFVAEESSTSESRKGKESLPNS